MGRDGMGSSPCLSAARAPARAGLVGAAPQHRQTARRSTPAQIARRSTRAQRSAPQTDSGALHAKKLYVHVTRLSHSPNVFKHPSINVDAHPFGAIGRPEPAALTTPNPRSHPDVHITPHFHLTPNIPPHASHADAHPFRAIGSRGDRESARSHRSRHRPSPSSTSVAHMRSSFFCLYSVPVSSSPRICFATAPSRVCAALLGSVAAPAAIIPGHSCAHPN